MNRHRAYWPLDESPAPSGDGFFTGVNARLDPAQLAEGEVSLAVNARFDEGRVATRKGIRILPWGAYGYGYLDPSLVLPYTDARLAETFSDPYGVDWLLIVAGSSVYKTQPGGRGTLMTIAAGETAAGAVDLVQTYNGMVMLRGPDEDPLYMRDVDEGWLAIPSPAVPGNEALPPATQGIYFQNRLFVVDGRDDSQHRDSVWVSDIGGITSTLEGETAYQSFRINQGSADRLVGIVKFNETTLVAAKQRSIYVVTNIIGTNEQLAANAILTEVTRQYGCTAPRTFVQVGSDLWFLANKRGVCSLRQTETNALQGVDVPVSRDIQPLVDRINWEWATAARAAVHDNRVFFAVPLDDSKTNSAILVFSTLTQKWAGYDLSQATRVLDFVKFTYAGVVRLGFVSLEGFICLYEDGFYDQTGDATGVVVNNDIETTVRTRGYGGKAAGNKRAFRASARIASWHGQYTVRALPNGYNEPVAVATAAKDRTRYMRPHGAAPWVPTNVADDWQTPFREDYSAQMGGVVVTGATGVGTMAFDVLQETEETWNVPRTEVGHVQLEVASARGRLEVIGIQLDTRRGTTAEGTHA